MILRDNGKTINIACCLNYAENTKYLRIMHERKKLFFQNRLFSEIIWTMTGRFGS